MRTILAVSRSRTLPLKHTVARFVIGCLFGLLSYGQTQTGINLSTQSRNPDFSAMPFTRPTTVGASLPTTCSLGQLFFNTSAQPGTNLNSCTASNTWTPVGVGSSSTGSGNSGNATSIQGAAVSSVPPAPNQTLVFSSSSSSYVPTSLYTIQNGIGTTVGGTTNVSVNVVLGWRGTANVNDIVLPSDCAGTVSYTSSQPINVSLPQPSLGGNFQSGCSINVYSAGSPGSAPAQIMVTPSNSTIDGNVNQTVNASKSCQFVTDGVNWHIVRCN